MSLHVAVLWVIQCMNTSQFYPLLMRMWVACFLTIEVMLSETLCYESCVITFIGCVLRSRIVLSLSVFFQAQYVQLSSSSFLQKPVPPPVFAVSVSSTISAQCVLPEMETVSSLDPYPLYLIIKPCWSKCLNISKICLVSPHLLLPLISYVDCGLLTGFPVSTVAPLSHSL